MSLLPVFVHLFTLKAAAASVIKCCAALGREACIKGTFQVSHHYDGRGHFPSVRTGDVEILRVRSNIWMRGTRMNRTHTCCIRQRYICVAISNDYINVLTFFNF